MRKWLCCLFFLIAVGQLGWSQSFDDQLNRINGHIKNGDYFRATNLCEDLLKKPFLSKEEASVVYGKLDWIKHFRDIDSQVFIFIRRRSYDEAIVTLKQIEGNGITNTRNKELLTLFQQASKYTNTPIEQRYIDAGVKYLEMGDKEKAKAIFLQFKDNPIAVLRLKEIEEESSTVITKPCDEAKYASLRREMNKLYGACQLAKAIQKANEILAMDCYQKDKFTLASMAIFRDIQRQLRDIAEWKSGLDNSRREFIIPAYERVFKKNRNCVEWDYFYYVYLSAERMRISDPCNKNAVSRYLQAKRISNTLANKENIDQKIAAIDKCTNCDDKAAQFVQITNEAQSFLKQCRYDDAIKRYKDAQPYNCSEKTQAITKKWSEELIPQIERNRTQANRFITLKASADSLEALGECTLALNFYQSADSIQLDCIKLNKQDIVLKISKMRCCVDINKFFGLRDTVRAALEKKIVLVKNNEFLNRRAICGKVIEADSLAKKHKCINDSEVTQLYGLSCKTCAAEYPNSFNSSKCPSPPSISTDTINKYQGVELIVNAFYNNPTISSATRLTLPTWDWGGWGVGLNYVHNWNSFGEWKAGFLFSNHHFQVNQPFSDRENFDFQLLKLSTEFDLKPKNKTNTYPFVMFGAVVNIPLKFNYQAGSRLVNNTTLLATGIGLKTGFGFVIKRNVSFSITYDFTDLFRAEAAKTPILINKSRYQTVGFNLGYRFLKYHKAK